VVGRAFFSCCGWKPCQSHQEDRNGNGPVSADDIGFYQLTGGGWPDELFVSRDISMTIPIRYLRQAIVLICDNFQYIHIPQVIIHISLCHKVCFKSQSDAQNTFNLRTLKRVYHIPCSNVVDRKSVSLPTEHLYMLLVHLSNPFLLWLHRI
jgi:hypothetical protein